MSSYNWSSHSKFHPPITLRTALIRKKFLLEKIHKINNGLLLFTAPAGYGKTTLLAQWYHKNLASQMAWLNLDEKDKTPVQFLLNLFKALLIDDLGENDEQYAFNLDKPEDIALESLLTKICNLVEGTENCTIILDDYYLAESENLENVINTLIPSLLISGCRIIISCRGAPHIKLSLLKVNSLLHTITEHDLKFDTSDIALIFDGKLSAKDTQQLSLRTGGWPAIVQLARMHSENKTVTEWMSGFPGKSEEVIEYLSEQVFSEFTSEQQEFFIESSFLDNFNAELVDAVRNRNDSARFLTDLVSFSTLITAFTANNWYRYNQLFKDFLLQQLKRDYQKFRTLCMRAANWYKENKDYLNAIFQYCYAKNYEGAVDLLNSLGGWIAGVRYGHSFLINVQRGFPEWYLNQSYTLQSLQVYYFIKQGNLKEARFRLEGLKKEDYQEFSNIRLILMELTLNLYEDKLITISEERELTALINNFPPNDKYLRSVSYSLLFVTKLYLGKTLDAISIAEESISFLRKENFNYALTFSYGHLGYSQMLQGLVNDAKNSYHEADALINLHFSNMESLSAIFKVLRFELDYWTNDLSGLDSLYLSAVKTISKKDGWFQVYFSAFSTAVRAKFEIEGYSSAVTYLASVETRGIPRLNALVIMLRAELDLKSRHTKKLSKDYSLQLEFILGQCWWNKSFFWQLAHLHLINRIRSAINLHHYDDANLLISEARSNIMHTQGAVMLSQELALWQALVNYMLGKARDAIALFDQTAKIIKKQGSIRLILDIDSSILRLVRGSVRQARNDVSDSIPIDFLNEIIIAIKEPHQNNYGLSKREYEVLIVLAEGGANKIIGRKLNLAEDTVKFHLKNIFKKIKVDNRAMAIAKAKRYIL